MAFTDIQNKVGQTQMANQILLAQSKIPPPNEGEGTRDYRKRISGGSYKNKPNPKNPYEGMTDQQQREAAAKNQEKLNIWSSLQQAEDNAGEHIPLVVFKRNRSKTYVAFELDKLMEILNEKNS